MATFLLVGGAGYVVDVGAFNLLQTDGLLASADPAVARTIAVILATAVTYLGNRMLTWRDTSSAGRTREVALFVLFNAIGFAISLATLVISHHVLGLTSRLADNISANVIGVALGTIFRFVTYKYVVFKSLEAVSEAVQATLVEDLSVDVEEAPLEGIRTQLQIEDTEDSAECELRARL